MKYKVTAPYITVKVQGLDGVTVRGYTAGALLPDGVAEESIRHHLKRKMIEKLAESAKPAAAETDPSKQPESAKTPPPASPAQQTGVKPDRDPDAPQPTPASPTPEPPPETGAGSSQAAWVEYAQARGIDKAKAETMSRSDLIKALKSSE